MIKNIPTRTIMNLNEKTLKLIFRFFIILVGLPLVFVLLNGFDFISYLTLYITSIIIVVLGFILYPIDKLYFLIFPFFGVLIVNIINIFTTKNFTPDLAVINILLGIFGAARYYLKNRPH